MKLKRFIRVAYRGAERFLEHSDDMNYGYKRVPAGLRAAAEKAFKEIGAKPKAPKLLITIEGAQGTGKTAIARMLRELGTLLGMTSRVEEYDGFSDGPSRNPDMLIKTKQL